MPDLNPRQFRMQTNMKAAPNSQGTLFQGGYPRAGAGQPWPRGYSPQRRDEVVAAMDEWQDPKHGRGNYPRIHAYLGPKYVTRGLSYKGPGTAEVAAGVSTLARSTVPVEHIRGARYHFGSRAVNDRSLGHYSPPLGPRYSHLVPPGGDPNTEANVHIGPGNAAGTTLIHEVGHHVSNLTGTPHSASQRGGDEAELLEARGQEESFAEVYAETHFRDHRGRPLANFETSPTKWHGHYGMPGPEVHYNYGDDDPRRSFHRGFYAHQAENSPSAKARKEHFNQLDRKGMYPTGIVGQIPLLGQETVAWHEDGNTPKLRELRDTYSDEREHGFG